MTMPSSLCALLALALVLGGCAGRSDRPAASTPDPELTAANSNQGPWLCLPASDNEAWDCDNDPDKVANPEAWRPARAPAMVMPEPIPRPEAPPVETIVPLTEVSELEAGVVDSSGDTLPPAPEAGSDLPEPRPPGLEDAVAEAAAAEPVAERQTLPADAPRYQQLAYQPAQPVSLMDMPPTFYAVQLTALSSAAELERSFVELEIQGLTAAEVERDGSRYYVLLLGIYEDFARAKAASADLPPPLDRFEPWIRRLGTLQSAMLRANKLAQDASP
jgi:septal ring-binding cell division protein DamX